MNTKPVFHGSDIEKICEYYHLKKEDIVRFGANVNPLGLSENVKASIASHLDLLSTYPDREYASLRETLSGYCGIPAEYILPGNGSSELIALLIEARAPKHTLILGPTYSEYSPSPAAHRNTIISRKKTIFSWMWTTSAEPWKRAMISSSSATRTTPLPPQSFTGIWNGCSHSAKHMTSS